eukprot:scaffold95583_cov37-Tisochrysis_lutea.AAC.1
MNPTSIEANPTLASAFARGVLDSAQTTAAAAATISARCEAATSLSGGKISEGISAADWKEPTSRFDRIAARESGRRSIFA